MVNPDVDGCIKPSTTRKYSEKRRKQQHTANQKNTKREIEAKWTPVFTFSLLGGRFAPLPPSVSSLFET